MKIYLFVFSAFLSTNLYNFAQQNIWEPIAETPGGDIYSLAVDQNNFLFAGTSLGFYKSTNNGDEWINISTGLGGYDVRSIIFNNSGDIFVGTNPGSGIFKSNDLGITWTHLEDSLVSFSISRLDINSSGHLFAAIRGHGVYRSTDNGENWAEMNNGLSYLSLKELYIPKAGPLKDFLFVSICELTDYSYIFRSSNNGEIWEQMNFSDTWFWTYAFVSTSDGSIYIGLWDTSPHSNNGAILKSEDFGYNWISAGSNAITTTFILDKNEYIYAGTQAGFQGGGQGIIRTTNGGSDWEPFNSGLGGSSGFQLAINSEGILFASWESQIYRTIESTTDINDNEVLEPEKFELFQNYPNPFNPYTTIKYQIPQSEKVTLKVYDVLGNEVVELVNDEKVAGEYEVEFDGKDLTSGIYFYQIISRDFVQTKKMILIK